MNLTPNTTFVIPDATPSIDCNSKPLYNLICIFLNLKHQESQIMNIYYTYLVYRQD